MHCHFVRDHASNFSGTRWSVAGSCALAREVVKHGDWAPIHHVRTNAVRSHVGVVTWLQPAGNFRDHESPQVRADNRESGKLICRMTPSRLVKPTLSFGYKLSRGCFAARNETSLKRDGDHLRPRYFAAADNPSHLRPHLGTNRMSSLLHNALDDLYDVHYSHQLRRGHALDADGLGGRRARPSCQSKPGHRMIAGIPINKTRASNKLF